MTITPVMMTITKSPMDYILGKRSPVTKMLQTIDRFSYLSVLSVIPIISFSAPRESCSFTTRTHLFLFTSTYSFVSYNQTIHDLFVADYFTCMEIGVFNLACHSGWLLYDNTKVCLLVESVSLPLHYRDTGTGLSQEYSVMGPPTPAHHRNKQNKRTGPHRILSFVVFFFELILLV